MGIRYLTTFVEKYFKGWKKTPVQGKLIVDISAVLPLLFEKASTEYNELCGGDYVSVAREMSRFLQTLVEAGINPIVVQSGTFNYDKADIIERRVEEKRKYIANLLLPVEKRDHEVKKRSISTRYLSTTAIIESVKRVVGDRNLFVADRTADVDIACLAIHHQCPVLSNDSDFYVFPLLYGYIPYSKFNWEDVRNNGVIYGEFYFYQAFCQQFGIRDESLLTLIPVITGNDTVAALDNEHLAVIMPKDEHTNDSHLIDDTIQYVASFKTFDTCLTTLRKQKMFGMVKTIQDVFQEYFFLPLFKPRNSLVTDLTCKDGSRIPHFILKKHRKGTFFTFVLNVLVYHKAHFSTAVENISESWCCLIGVPIRSAIYGILCGTDVSILEAQRCAHAVNQKEVEVKSTTHVTYDGEEIPLPTLQSCGLEVDKEYGKKILFGILNSKKEDFKKVPQDYQLLLAITRYWYKHCTIYKKDILLNAFILLLQLSEERKIERSLRIRVPVKPLFPIASFTHAFSQWQSLYRDIQSLDQLLQEPLKLLPVSQFLECSYLYSLVEAVIKGGVFKVIQQHGLDQSVHQVFSMVVSY